MNYLNIEYTNVMIIVDIFNIFFFLLVYWPQLSQVLYFKCFSEEYFEIWS